MRPLLRYVGGKWRQRKHVEELFGYHHYTDLTVGGGSLLVGNWYIDEINDINDRVINVYRVVKNDKSRMELKRLIALTPRVEEEEWRSAKKKEKTLGEVNEAYATIIVNRFSYMGWGQQWDYNKSEWGGYEEVIDWWGKRLNGRLAGSRAVKVWASKDILKGWWGNRNVIIDPPYVHEGRSIVNFYGDHTIDNGQDNEMTDDDHKRLLSKCLRHKRRVVIFGLDSDLYKERLKGWRNKNWDIPVGCGSDLMRENVWWNFGETR